MINHTNWNEPYKLKGTSGFFSKLSCILFSLLQIQIWSPFTNNCVVPIWAIFGVKSTRSHGPIKWIKASRTCLSIFQKLNASGVQCTMINPPICVNQGITWMFEKKIHGQLGILVTHCNVTFFNNSVVINFFNNVIHTTQIETRGLQNSSRLS